MSWILSWEKDCKFLKDGSEIVCQLLLLIWVQQFGQHYSVWDFFQDLQLGWCVVSLYCSTWMFLTKGKYYQVENKNLTLWKMWFLSKINWFKDSNILHMELWVYHCLSLVWLKWVDWEKNKFYKNGKRKIKEDDINYLPTNLFFFIFITFSQFIFIFFSFRFNRINNIFKYFLIYYISDNDFDWKLLIKFYFSLNFVHNIQYFFFIFWKTDNLYTNW